MIKPALTTEAMQAADRRAIEEYGIPGFTLMETAGRAAFRAIAAAYGLLEQQTVTILAGKGNNGGDGLVVARLLFTHGAQVHVVTLGNAESMKDDARQNLQLLQQLEARDDTGRLRIDPFDELDALEQYASSDLFVDALLGTGLTKPLRSPVREIVKWLNSRDQPVIALDIPTGLNSDTGVIHGAAVEADLTVTMGALKTGLLLNRGPNCSGHIETVEIGIPSYILREEGKRPGCARTISDDAVRSWLPKRSLTAHKYNVGMVVALAGSRGLTGAPTMASTAAARAGAGAVVCACPLDIQPVLAQKMTEVMTLGLPENETGGLSPDVIEQEAFQQRLAKATALLIGCGLGNHPDTQATVRQLLRTTDLPIILDADGLNALIDHIDLLIEHADGRVVLTPHVGEFRRIIPDDLDLTDRIRVAEEYARRWNCILVLKGLPSIVASPGEPPYINTTGNPALATAGTGDVLAGLCAGFAAQGVPPAKAAIAGLRIGGAAADTFIQTRDPRSLLATDIIDELPALLHRRF